VKGVRTAERVFSFLNVFEFNYFRFLLPNLYDILDLERHGPGESKNICHKTIEQTMAMPQVLENAQNSRLSDKKSMI